MTGAMMRAMVFRGTGRALALEERPIPEPGPGEVLVRVAACGVCRTDLHVVDGELARPRLPLVPGHEAVGRVAALGTGVERLRVSQRVGIPWLGWTCGACRFCRSGRENLCPDARFTGYTRDGGYADHCIADQRYCLPLADGRSDTEAAPLLCAGLIGYRALRMAGDAARIGLYGFGAAAHIIAQVARHQGRLAAAVQKIRIDIPEAAVVAGVEHLDHARRDLAEIREQPDLHPYRRSRHRRAAHRGCRAPAGGRMVSASMRRPSTSTG